MVNVISKDVEESEKVTVHKLGITLIRENYDSLGKFKSFHLGQIKLIVCLKTPACISFIVRINSFSKIHKMKFFKSPQNEIF